MSKQAQEPLVKITINIYRSDHEFIKDRYGYGWSEMVRQFLRGKVQELKERDKND